MGDSSPTLSVLVVNYNAGALLAECVGSVLATSIDLEVIVSDNGSTDDSLSVVRERYGDDRRLRVLENGANLGFARGHNTALRYTHGRFLLFLNPDCILGPDTLIRMIAFMEGKHEAGMAGCVIRDPDGSEQKASRRRIPDPWIGLVRFLHLERFSAESVRNHRLNLIDERLPDHPVEVEAISGSFMFVRRAALDEVGPLDEGYFLHCEDLDWFARFAASDWKIYLVPDVDVVHHQGSCSTGRPVAVEWHKHKGMQRFFQKFQFQRYPLPFSALVVVGIWAHFGAFLLSEAIRRLIRTVKGAG